MEAATTKKTKNIPLTIAFIPLAVGINLGIGTVVQLLKLPIFLDSIGTIITALLLGWRSGAVVGVLSFVISSITSFPPAVYFSGTQVAIAAYVYLIAKAGGFKNVFKSFLSGFGLALVAAFISAPVIYFLFGGITGNGISVFTIYLEHNGFGKPAAVLISGISAELLDKTAQCLIVFFVLTAVPQSILKYFHNKNLVINYFIK